MKKLLAIVALCGACATGSASACTFEIIYKAAVGSEAVPLTNVSLDDDGDGNGRLVAKKLMPGSSTGTLVRRGNCEPMKLQWSFKGRNHVGTFMPQPDATGMKVITLNE